MKRALTEPVVTDTKTHFWLRHEIKIGEGRTPLLPQHVKILLDKGHQVTVEKSSSRCVSDEEYAKVGATLVQSETWENAPKDTIVVGLKELPENDKPLIHGHIYFAHCFKGQSGAKELLTRFKNGGGCLWDLEFLNLENGRRVAAFGRAAGIVGMAIGLLVWAFKQLDPTSPTPCRAFLERYDTYEDLAAYVTQELAKAKEKAGYLPKPIVIGALGRCGGGSCDFAEKVGISVTKWDLDETKAGGPFKEILVHDIFVNCIYLMSKIPPFINKELLQTPERKLNVIVDVSCDTTNPNNPVPVYEGVTTFLNPTLRITEDENPIDVVAIDHLPSLVPSESSIEFDDSLIEYLLQFPSSPVFTRAKKLFEDKLVSVLQ